MVVNASFYRLCSRVQYGTGIKNRGEKIESALSHATPIGPYEMQTADCKIADREQNADWWLGTKHRQRINPVFRLIRDNMSSKNIRTEFDADAFPRSSLVNVSIIVEYSFLVSSYILS